MTNSSQNINRRIMLRSSGLVAATGAFLAACGSSAPNKIARIGETPVAEKLAEATVSDVVLLRTAMSVETMVKDMLTNSAVTSIADKEHASVIAGFAAAHVNHLNQLRPLITSRNGEVFEGTNEKLMASYGTKALELIEEGKDKADVLAITLALETLVASMYQYFVSLTTEPALRASMIGVGAESSKAAAVAAQMINPGIGAFVPGEKDGVATVATLPNAFGSLSAVQVVLGPVNDTGSRATVLMDTPSLNSFIY